MLPRLVPLPAPFILLSDHRARLDFPKGDCMTKSVEEYLASLPGWQATMGTTLVRIIRGASPKLAGAIKWGQPVFESDGPVCYVKAHKNHVNLGFWRGVALMELDDRLETSGSKMAHIKFTEHAELNKSQLTKLVKAAVELNRTLGNPNTQRGPK